MNKFPASLEPDSEKRLFEKLAMDDADLKDLEDIRRLMKRIYEDEQGEQKESGS